MFKDIVIFSSIVMISFVSTNVKGQIASSGWKEEDRIYSKVFDAPLSGKQLRKGTTLYQVPSQKPTVLALIFTRCTGVCNPFLLELKENIELRTNEKNFNILVMSFDPRDTEKDLDDLAMRFGLSEDKRWEFAVTDSIRSLVQSIGFKPVWDSLRQQYDHDALLIGINSEGYITKKLIGIRNNADLGLLLASIQDSFTPTYRMANPNMLFSCFNYDVKTGKNTPGLGLIFVALPALIAMVIVLSVNFFVRVNRI